MEQRVTSTFEQALDTLLDKEDAWVVNRLPCHGLVFARGNSATDIEKFPEVCKATFLSLRPWEMTLSIKVGASKSVNSSQAY